MLATLGEEKVCEIFSSFSSPLNNDVEYFLKKKSITFDRQGISKTHLVFTSYKNEIVFIGYFTLSLKSFTIPAPVIAQLIKIYDSVDEHQCRRKEKWYKNITLIEKIMLFFLIKMLIM